jgi:Family of unknown function (DUF6173)
MTTTGISKEPRENIERIHKYHLASEYHQLIAERMQRFRDQLDHTEDLGLRILGTSDNLSFYVTGLYHADPNLLAFSGITLADEPIEVIQQTAQINFVLIPLPRRHPDISRQPLEFEPKDY